MKKYLDFKFFLSYVKQLKLFDLLLISIVLIICFDKLLMRYLILLTAIIGLVIGNYTLIKKRTSTFKLSLVLLWIIPFLQLLFLGLFKEYWGKLETKLSLLIIPIIILISLKIENDFFKKLIKYFVYGCFISVVFCLINATYNFLILNNVKSFSYSTLSIFHHPGYFAMYINFSIGILYLKLIDPLKNNNSNKKILILIFIFSCFIVLLASRTGWVTNLLIHGLFVAFNLKKKSLKKIHVLFGLSIILCFTLMNKIPSIKSRSNEVINSTVLTEKKEGNKLKKQIKYTSSSNTRKLAWETSFGIIKDNILFGVGTGKSTSVLDLNYEKKGYNFLKNKSINCHNEFIQFQLDHGLIGSICLFFFTFIMLIFSIKEKDLIYALFLFIIILNFMTESMLETQSGVVFFSIFNTLFFFKWIDNKYKVS